MLKFLVPATCLLVTAGAAAAAAQAPQSGATSQARATCDAKSYHYLVGRDMANARDIQTDDYRLLPANSAHNEVKPKRITILYDDRSNQITEVGCG